MTSSADNLAGGENSTDVELPADGEIISLAEARRRFGREILHSPFGCASTYIDIEVHGGVWEPFALDFFCGVIAYRFRNYFGPTVYFA